MKDMQRGQPLLTMVVNQILRNPLTGESASSRMKQVVLMTVIYTCIPHDSVVSLSDLVRITGLTRAGIVETIEPLVRRGLLIKTMGKNSMGRGMARYFEIASSLKPTVVTGSRFLGAEMLTGTAPRCY